MSRLEVIPYDPRWPEQFADERERLSTALGELARRIEHNGSTSVPGLPAKPVIDIQISVVALQPMDAYRVPLQLLGYVHVPHEHDSFSPYFHRPSDWPHAHHVHVVEMGGEEEARTLAFRDYLRNDTEAAEAYARLKLALAPQFSAEDELSRQAYSEAKGGVHRGDHSVGTRARLSALTDHRLAPNA